MQYAYCSVLTANTANSNNYGRLMQSNNFLGTIERILSL